MCLSYLQNTYSIKSINVKYTGISKVKIQQIEGILHVWDKWVQELTLPLWHWYFPDEWHLLGTCINCLMIKSFITVSHLQIGIFASKGVSFAMGFLSQYTRVGFSRRHGYGIKLLIVTLWTVSFTKLALTSDQDFRNGVANIFMFILLLLRVIALVVLGKTILILKWSEWRIELNYRCAVQNILLYRIAI